jgi:hypothetical protein
MKHLTKFSHGWLPSCSRAVHGYALPISVLKVEETRVYAVQFSKIFELIKNKFDQFDLLQVMNIQAARRIWLI